MKKILFIIILSLCYGNFSYQGLLLPNSSYNLSSGYSQYLIFKDFLFDNEIKKKVSTSILMLPQDINITSLQYLGLPFNCYDYFSITIIDYGEFLDSESNIRFNAKDIIFKNNFIAPINNKLKGSVGGTYMNSNIENYSSSTFSIQASLSIKHNNFLVNTSINNYGFVINHYTSHNESLHNYYNIFIMYLPKYLDSVLSISHNSFNNYSTTNLFGELFIKDNYSITIGYSSIAQKLYYENFSSNFFTGISIGFNIKYQDYLLNFGIKNLGATGLINSLTFSKSLN
tara:strand:+ start:841 stop:1695 length:855 start_codon:yes stop_codon:yes gene_type:complete